MINIYSGEEIKLIETANVIARRAIFEAAKFVKIGVSTLELDKIAEDYILVHDGIPSFKGYMGFPGNTCISVNSEVIHGIPSSERFLSDGDLVSIDIGVIYKGYYGDTSHTFPVGNVKEEYLKLMETGELALEKGINAAIVGNRIGDIAYAIQATAEEAGYNVVRDFVGHGVGKHIHEDPQVPNYGKKGFGLRLKRGNVIALEPMINEGTFKVEILDDGWTVVTADGSMSVHFEKSIAVDKGKAQILSHL